MFRYFLPKGHAIVMYADIYKQLSIKFYLFSNHILFKTRRITTMSQSHDTVAYRLASILQKLNQGEKLDPNQLAEEYQVNRPESIADRLS